MEQTQEERKGEQSPLLATLMKYISLATSNTADTSASLIIILMSLQCAQVDCLLHNLDCNSFNSGIQTLKIMQTIALPPTDRLP